MQPVERRASAVRVASIFVLAVFATACVDGGGGGGQTGGGTGGGSPPAGGGGGPGGVLDGGVDGSATADGGGDDHGSLPRFAAVGYGGRRIVSDDGTEWRDEVFDIVGGSDDDLQFRGVTVGDGRFFAVGGSGEARYASTTDGVVWSTHEDDDGWLGGVAYGEGVWVAAGGNGRRVRSEDGESFATVTVDYAAHFRDVAFGGGAFVAVGDSGRRARSDDGVSWTHDVTGGGGFTDVAYGNGAFVAVGPGRRIRSVDGTSWDHEVAGGGRSVVFGDGEFLVVGGTTAYTSPDGAEWTSHTLNRPVELVAYADGIYVGSAWTNAGPTFLRSTDGLAWEQVGSGGNGLSSMVGAPRD